MSQAVCSSLPLVRVRGEAKGLSFNDIAVDPFLFIEAHEHLQLSSLVDKEPALGCLGHKILSSPADLRAHVRRILLLAKDGNGAALYSALLDLLIILQSNGRALKQRMIWLAQPFLAPATFEFFQRHLEQGVAADDPYVTRVKGSLLRESQMLGVPLVKRSNDHAGRPVGVMEQVNALLEYGQLEHAVELLENALLENPDQEPEAELLLGLYRSLREETRWHGMCEQLQLTFNRLPVAWTQKPEFF
ncbi:MAG: hypothetical protein PHF20_06810 [Halothiobacillaceae bacterium]|nr:hypothetical protein [Halothiobacillaceae bacterium]